MRQTVSQCMKQMVYYAKKDNTTVYDVAVKILSQSPDELDAYIRSKNEVPADTMNGKILQSALLRMEDISLIARASSIPENEALAHIEEAETEAIKLNTAERGKILTPSSQAALKVVYEELQNQVADSAGTRSFGESLDLIRKTMATPKDHLPAKIITNNFSWKSVPDNFDFGGIFSTDTGGSPAPSPTPNYGGIFSSDTSPGTTNNSGDTSSSIWDLIGRIATGAASVAKSVGSIGGSVSQTAGNITGSLNNLGSNVATNALNNYVSQNWWKILLFVIFSVLVIILIARATKHK